MAILEERKSSFETQKKSSYTVHPSPYPMEVPGFHSFPSQAFWSFLLLTPGLFAWFMGFPMWSYLLIAPLMLIPLYAIFMISDSNLKSWAYSQSSVCSGLSLGDYMKFNDLKMASKYLSAEKSRIPIETFFEAYFDGKIDIKGDMLDLLENRHEWAGFGFTFGHLSFLIQNLLPEAAFHSRSQDEAQVRDHYDRGNDFYEAFLGPMMVYTSGIINKPDERETLEELQENKLKLILNKINLKSTDKLLDIGCGWGTLACYAAKNFGVDATGVTIAREQTEHGMDRANKWKVQDKVKILCCDYRDIPRPHEPNGTKFDKITCLEMAEHVGIRKFNRFLNQVSELLTDDGVFYLQIAGLRRPWQYEDLIWGLFMNKYVFPGADASCPLAWVVSQLEYAGFEVQSVDTIGVHYSATIERWYQNWLKPENRAMVVEKYGEKAWRTWEMFLAWSTIISRQGSATCYQIVCHKNTNRFDRKTFFQGHNLKRLSA